MTLYSFDYPPNHGGIARLCAEIAAGLGRRVRIDILTQQRADMGSGAPKLPETRVAPQRPRREWSAWRVLRRRRVSGPVVTGTWYPEGLLAWLARAQPHIILAHGSELLPPPQRWRRPLWAWLQRQVLNSASLIVANSAYTGRLVTDSAPGCRVSVIPPAVDHRRFHLGNRRAAKQRLEVAQPHQLVLCSVSRLCIYKGHGTVFRALAALPEQEREKFVYLIAGRGPDQAALQAEAVDLGIASLVRWLGFISEEELPDLYRAADLFVLCTREVRTQQEVEGFGLVFLEAQACGTPVVGTRTGGIPDAVAEGEGGWLIEQDDAVALADILGDLVEHPERFAEQGRLARARVEREFTWEHYLERFTAALHTEGIHVG